VELRALLAWEEMKSLVAFETLTLPIYDERDIRPRYGLSGPDFRRRAE
jgi:hypothetical protein